MDETELLQKIKADPSYFAEVFRLYYKPVFGYILRRTGNFDDTADIVADTFLKAFTHIHSFAYRGISIKVWLYRIASNELNQFYRHIRKHNSLFMRMGLINQAQFKAHLSYDREEMETELHRHEQFMHMLAILKTLPFKYQEVIALRYFEGFDNKQIADILEMNEGTLKSLLSRGLEKLREKCNH